MSNFGFGAFGTGTFGDPDYAPVISGHVRIDGNPVKGAIVRAINRDNHETFRVQTDETGYYKFGAFHVTGANYSLVVEHTDDQGNTYHANPHWDAFGGEE